MKKWLPDAVALSIIALAVISFFWKFFVPIPQLLVTPDFGRSDAWHFSFPTKYLLSEKLKTNTIPVWSSKLGTGFPLLAEGQTGTFFLPNLILFRSFDPVTAFNLSLVITTITIGWGTYVFLRKLSCSRLASLFGGLTISFSGLVQTELPHITLLTGFSLLPWILIATDNLIQKKSFTAISILSILISQQLFAGFPQATFITLLFAGGYFLFTVIPAHAGIHQDGSPIRSGMTKDFLRFVLVILFAVGLSAVQLLPSLEFLHESSSRNGFSPRDAAYFSYPLKHLVTFLDPYRLGNPKLGTYPAFSAFDGSIFWENTGFIGIVPLVLFFLFIKMKLPPSRWNRIATFLIISLLVSFLLMLGSHSPLYIIYSFWPFNLFRVPSRFLWIFVFCLVTVSALSIDMVKEKIAHSRLLGGILLLFLFLNTFYLAKQWESYQATAPATSWTHPPEIVKFLSSDRTFTLGSELTHNQTFFAKGWQDMTPYYELRNSLAADSNVVWNISSLQVYAGRFLRRQSLVDSLLRTAIDVDTKQATVSGRMQKILTIFSVRQLVSTVPVESSNALVYTGTITQGNSTFYVYKNPDALGRTYLARRAVVAQTFEDAVRKIQEDTFVPGESVLTEEAVNLSEGRDGGDTEITRETDTSVTVAVRANPMVSLLILADTYYPGWHAFVDGIETGIIAVNMNERGVIVDPGNHTVRFVYDPQNLRVGKRISSITFLLVAAGFLLPSAAVHTRQKVSARRRHSLRNRARSRLHTG